MQHVTTRTASPPMTPDERAFFTGLGQRIAQARKDADLTQQQLADRIGILQPQLASYEIGRRRVPVSLLPKLGRALGVSVEELIDDEAVPPPAVSARRRRGPASRLERQLEQLARLPKASQKAVSQVLDAMLAQHAG
jgi:transcriptional regulator with XRE-family HTH domain